MILQPIAVFSCAVSSFHLSLSLHQNLPISCLFLNCPIDSILAPKWTPLRRSDRWRRSSWEGRKQYGKGRALWFDSDGFCYAETQRVSIKFDLLQSRTSISLTRLVFSAFRPNATKAIRKAGCDSFIVGVSGNVLPEDVAYFREHEANAVLPKPVQFSDLETLWYEYGFPEKEDPSPLQMDLVNCV